MVSTDGLNGEALCFNEPLNLRLFGIQRYMEPNKRKARGQWSLSVYDWRSSIAAQRLQTLNSIKLNQFETGNIWTSYRIVVIYGQYCLIIFGENDNSTNLGLLFYIFISFIKHTFYTFIWMRYCNKFLQTLGQPIVNEKSLFIFVFPNFIHITI